MSRHDGKVWVRKLRTHYSSHPWEVRARNLNGYDYYETFYDWADAMEAADRLARTREVVLPRVNFEGRLQLDILHNQNGVSVSYKIDDRPPQWGTEHQLPSFATFILALAEQQGVRP